MGSTCQPCSYYGVTAYGQIYLINLFLCTCRAGDKHRTVRNIEGAMKNETMNTLKSVTAYAIHKYSNNAGGTIVYVIQYHLVCVSIIIFIP